MAPHPDHSPDRVRLEVGRQLRFHRHRAGLSQTQVASATGWSLSAISLYEQGNRQAGYAKRFEELEGLLDERSRGRASSHDERSRIRGSKPSQHGLGRGL